MIMAKPKDTHRPTELITLQPDGNITVLPPNSGVVGSFLEQTANMFKARAMRMGGLLRRIDDAGQRTEALLRAAAERMEAAEASLEEQFSKEGLVKEFADDENNSID
jgi:hypothetical protein